MSSCSTWVNDQENHRTCCQSRGFITPPSTRETNQICPDTFHVIHKVPYGDSPYVRAKRVQLIDKDPSKAISLFWAAINSGDRVDSALKDMAVVMKQLDRSDEAIEAIKSFRHLCPSESQESLDNILVDLYKQSGRIEEEIEILRFKVKQVEEGFVFGGKRVKMARSQGKKILIPVEKEYSRLLGNLAWAYMQQKDFKSAEEHYRKALSFDSDKNKQCNLAMCLMHMNKLTEAKFLLQAVKYSYNQCAEESHAKSYERASQMLVELESQKTLKPMKHSEHNTDVSYEKRAEFDWRRNHSHQLNMGREAADHGCKRVHDSPFCGGGIPRVPFTQPQQNFNSGDQRNTRLAGSGYGGFCRKLSYGPSGDSENQNQQTDWRNCKKSRADVVDEQVYLGFNNENVDFNIISETPGSLNQVEKLSQKIESIDLDDGYITQPEKPKNQTVRRSLYFNQNQMHGTGTNHLPLPVEALNFEGQTLVLPEDLSSVKSTNQTKRLQVFQDITHAEK